MTADVDRKAHIDAVRRFNRFYTRRIGVLQEGLLNSPFSLTEARVLFELAHREKPTATALRNDLALDAGYLSRILSGFEKHGLVEKTPSEADRRQSLLVLTKDGSKTFAALEARSVNQVGAMMEDLSESDVSRLTGAMQTISKLLDGSAESDRGAKTPYLLRPHQPGDMGWVVHRHGVLYAQEYGYDETFEALVAEIVAKFIQRLNAKRERCWIAERDGEIAGCVFLVSESKTVAKLRLLLVEPAARGLGIGARLVSECVRFARQSGYRKIVLWTQSELDAARQVYKKAGFHVIQREKHHSFGKDLVAETWQLTL